MVAVGAINIRILKTKWNGQTQPDTAERDMIEKYHSKAQPPISRGNRPAKSDAATKREKINK
jgi:hypothetical protein